jgi:hypothetical protein
MTLSLLARRHGVTPNRRCVRGIALGAAGRKKLASRAELPAAQRDIGPDICIRKSRRKIWIEAMAPSPGDEKNLNQVPDLFVAGDGARDMPQRQIELRNTGALRTKLKVFQKYRSDGIIDKNDSCIVAISVCQFALEAAGEGLSHTVKGVYPFGQEFIEFNGGRSTLFASRTVIQTT